MNVETTLGLTKIVFQWLSFTMLVSRFWNNSSNSPSLASGDYFLFPKLKEHLRGIHFMNNVEDMTAIDELLAEQQTEFF